MKRTKKTQPTPMQLFECEQEGVYHVHWLTTTHVAAATAAFEHADEIRTKLTRLNVSSMCPPPEGKGLVYVRNDTQTFVREHGRVKQVSFVRVVAPSQRRPRAKKSD